MDLELDSIFQQSKRVALRDKPTASDVFAPAKSLLPSGEDDAGVEAPAKKPIRREEAPERLSRTLFVGNVPISVVSDRKIQRALRRIFESVGPVESLRIRSVIGKKALPKKVAYITGQTIDERDSCNAFVVMKGSADCTRAEEQLNGQVFEGRHLRVDAAENANRKPNSKKSVFVGNLPHFVSDEALWALFENCGTITSVRVIRDKGTGAGKGFGYVTFQEKASLELALQLSGSDCGGRPIRVSKCAKPGYQVTKKEHLEKRRLKFSHGKQTQAHRDAPTSRPKAGASPKPPVGNGVGTRRASSHTQKAQLTRLKSRPPQTKDAATSQKEPQHPAARRLERKLKKAQASTTNNTKVQKALLKRREKPLRLSKALDVSDKQRQSK